MDWVIIIHIFIWWLEIIGYDLDRPSTDYSFYEVESVDFSSGGRMYFTGNEKINERDADKVRYYY